MCNVDDSPSPAEDAEPLRSDDIAAVDAVDYLSPPQLGIRHLLAWLTVSAVMLRLLTPSQSNCFSLGGALLQTQQHAVDIIRAADYSAVLCGTIILLRAKFRQVQRPLQPGHWICLATAPHLATVAVIEAYLRLIANGNTVLPGFVLAMCWTVPWTMLVAVVAFGWCAVQRRYASAWWWRLVFSVLTLSCAGFFLVGLQLLDPFSGTPAINCHEAKGVYGTITLAVIAAVSSDWQFRVRRDWLHWLGVVSLFVDCLICLAS